MIIGKKIILRLFRNEEEVIDMNNIFNNLSDRSDMDHTEIYSMVSEIKLFHEDGLWTQNHGTLLIATKEDKKLGTISFSRKSDFELSIGYRILQKENRDKGYMTEGLSLFSYYLFNTIPLITRLSLYTAENNIPSCKLAEKCGYKQEGILRNAYFYRGKICNWVIYSLLREEVLMI